MTSSSIIILLTSILFCTATVVLAFMLKRSNSSKDKLLTEMQAALNFLQNSGHNQEKHLDTEQSASIIFDDNLREAELTTRLQQPRLTVQQGGYAPAPPERYRYIQSMVEKGMNVEEIASTLSMSLHETTQLVTLIRMAHPQYRNNEPPLSAPEIVDNFNILSVPQEQLTTPCALKTGLAPKATGTVNKPIKFARWLKGRAIGPCLRKQSGREPPHQPLPHIAGRFCQPLPGYT